MFLIDYNSGSIEVSFPYNPLYVDLIKQLDNRRWKPESKRWVIGLSDVEMLKKILEKNNISYSFGEKYVNTFNKQDIAVINEWNTRLPLHKYQVEGANKLYNNDCFAIFDDTGLGKTAQVISVLQKLYLDLPNIVDAEQFKVLIICPSSLVQQWKEEIIKFSYFNERNVNCIKGSKLKRQEMWNNLKNINIMNYDLIRFDDNALTWNWDLIVLDEATRIKNFSTKTFQLISKLKSKRKIIATATPIENNVKELYALFSFLNPGLLGSYKSFRNNYFVEELRTLWDGREFMELIGYKNLDHLKRLITPFYIRRTKEEVMSQLPNIISQNLYIELSPNEKTLYKHIQMLIESKKSQNNDMSDNSIIGLYQLQRVLCNGEYCLKYSQTNDPDIIPLQMKAKESSKKIDECINLINQIINNNKEDKILVFSDFISPFELLKRKLVESGIGYAELSGSVNKEEQIKKFKENPNIKVFLIQTKTGGSGINLQESNHVIFLNKPFNPATEYQALSRSHRQGQQKTVFVYNFIVEDGIEERIIEILKTKKDLSVKVIEKDIYK